MLHDTYTTLHFLKLNEYSKLVTYLYNYVTSNITNTNITNTNHIIPQVNTDIIIIIIISIIIITKFKQTRNVYLV